MPGGKKKQRTPGTDFLDSFGDNAFPAVFLQSRILKTRWI
jgi:hypothetical protein